MTYRHLLYGMVFFGLTSFIRVERDATPFENRVKWMTIEEAEKLSKTNKKKVFIDVYTDWCGWCKVMDKNTFNHEKIADYLNENFYPVKLNAEQREDILFRGSTYKFIEQGSRGYHQLAAIFLNGRLSYPTVVFLDEDLNGVTMAPGYMKPNQFDVVLKYIGDNHYKTVKWGEFQKTYKSPI